MTEMKVNISGIKKRRIIKNTWKEVEKKEKRDQINKGKNVWK